MADRTVTTTLVLKIQRYIADARSAKTATHGITEEVVDAGRATDKLAAGAAVAGKATDRLGDEMKDAARAAKQLDREIADVSRSLARLAVQQTLTGDQSLSKPMKEHENRLRELVRVRKQLAAAGAQGAEDFSLSFAKGIVPLLARAPLSPPLMAAAGVAAAGIVPLVGASISAGVTAGLSGAVIATGVAQAAKDPRVKEAGSALVAALSGSLASASPPFIEPVLRAISIFRSVLDDVGGDVRDMFSATSRYVVPLAEGIAELIRELVPAISRAVQRAGPVIDVLAKGLPRLGDAIGDAFDDITRNSGDAAGAMEFIIMAAERVIRWVGTAIGTLAGWFSDVVDFNLGLARAVEAVAMLSPLTSATVGAAARNAISDLEHIKATIDNAGKGAGDATGPSNGLADAFRGIGAGAGAAAGTVGTLTEQIREHAHASLAAYDATTAFEEAIDDATAAAKENGKTVDKHSGELDRNTAKGRANASALSRLAAQTLASRDATEKLSGTQGAAQEVMQRGYDKFVRAAVAMGLSKVAADRLARSLGLIPPAKTVSVTANTAGAVTAVSYLQAKIRELRSKHITVGASVRWTSSGLHVPGGTVLAKRWGGIAEHAQSGLLRDAAVYTPMFPARYAFAEPATGGEAFIPKRGDYGRSMAILDRAAGWYGAKVVTAAPSVARSGVTVHNHYAVTLSNHGAIGSRMELENWLTGAIDSLRRHGRM